MRPDRQPENVQELYHITRRALRGLSDEHESWIFNGQGYDRASRIGTFDLCLSRDDSGVRLAGRGPSKRILVEASGRACDAIREPELSRTIVSSLLESITRMDYAVDIRTGTVPSEFVNARGHKAFRTLSYIQSDTGTTAYVGSPKSDRFARVYRYNPPHPRSELLRVEFVFRRGMARAAATQYCQQNSNRNFLSRLGNTWGWKHRDWQPDEQSNEKLEVPSVDRKTEDTIAWLYKQVAPAMRRVLQSGGFDMADFLERVYNQ